MTKAELILEKEAGFGKALVLSSLLTLPVKAQFGWIAKNTVGPLIKTLSGDRAIPKLDTMAKSFAPVTKLTAEHPHFKEYTSTFRELLGDSTLNFKAFHVDSAQLGKRRLINVFGEKENGEITTRLLRSEAIPGVKGNPKLIDREQWADEVSQDTATNFLKQRTSTALKRKVSLANR
jgi:hypothetical protein